MKMEAANLEKVEDAWSETVRRCRADVGDVAVAGNSEVAGEGLERES